MLIDKVPFTVTDWNGIEAVEVKGETGTSFWRMFEKGNIRVRIIDYSSDYRADHWCGRGHVLLVLEGELIIELKNGEKFTLSPGKSFQASDDENNPHLVYSELGAKVFIVD